MGTSHVRTNGSRHNLAAALIQRANSEDLKEAESLERVALKDGLKTFGHDHVSPLANYQFLARALLLQGRFQDAEPHARSAFGGCRRLLDPSNARIGKCALILVAVLEKQGKPLDKDLVLFLESAKQTSPASKKVAQQKRDALQGLRNAVDNPMVVSSVFTCIVVAAIVYYRFRAQG